MASKVELSPIMAQALREAVERHGGDVRFCASDRTVRALRRRGLVDGNLVSPAGRVALACYSA